MKCQCRLVTASARSPPPFHEAEARHAREARRRLRQAARRRLLPKLYATAFCLFASAFQSRATLDEVIRAGSSASFLAFGRDGRVTRAPPPMPAAPVGEFRRRWGKSLPYLNKYRPPRARFFRRAHDNARRCSALMSFTSARYLRCDGGAHGNTSASPG